MLTLVLFLPAVAGAQDAEPTDGDPTEQAAEDETSSNVMPLLIGAILLGGGVWSYTHKKERFPGTRFRD